MLKMDSGWAQFRVLYNFNSREQREISIEEGDVMIVAKPVFNYTDWLTGQNTRTGDVGEFPGTYVEYIGDIDKLPYEENVENEEKPPEPPPRPPRPPKSRPNKPGECCFFALLFQHACIRLLLFLAVIERCISFSLKGAGIQVVLFVLYIQKAAPF